MIEEKKMQITTFNPMIITANVDEIIKTFEALGVTVQHPSGSDKNLLFNT